MLAEQRLRSAEGKWRQLQVVDESLASLASMGFRTSEVWPYFSVDCTVRMHALVRIAIYLPPSCKAKMDGLL